MTNHIPRVAAACVIGVHPDSENTMSTVGQNTLNIISARKADNAARKRLLVDLILVK